MFFAVAFHDRVPTDDVEAEVAHEIASATEAGVPAVPAS